MSNVIEIELALQDGAVAKIVDGRVVITIDSSITKRDLWDTQIEVWLSKKKHNKVISGGYFRVVKNKLTFTKG